MSDQSLDELIAGLLTEAAEENAAEEATPLSPIKRNPWKFKGIKLTYSRNICSRCNAETIVSHGLVQHFEHERDDRMWETALVPSSLDLPEPFLGYTELSSGFVHGCLSCIKPLDGDLS